MFFGTESSGRCNSLPKLHKPSQEHRRLRHIHSELCTEKRLQRLFQTENLRTTIHYYDENEIEVGKPIQCQVAVNHVVELTEEEKQEAGREKGGCPISADGTPKAAEPQQADSEKRNTSPTLII